MTALCLERHRHWINICNRQICVTDTYFWLDPFQSSAPNFTFWIYSSFTLSTCYLSETDPTPPPTPNLKHRPITQAWLFTYFTYALSWSKWICNLNWYDKCSILGCQLEFWNRKKSCFLIEILAIKMTWVWKCQVSPHQHCLFRKEFKTGKKQREWKSM